MAAAADASDADAWRARRRPTVAPRPEHQRRRRSAAAARSGSTAPRHPATRCAAAATAGRPARSSRSAGRRTPSWHPEERGDGVVAQRWRWPRAGTVRAPRRRRAPSRSARAAAGGRAESRSRVKPIRPVRPISSSSSEVIRNPLSTKKTSTPRKPPDRPGMPPWSASTSATAMARTPSSAGIPRPGLTISAWAQTDRRRTHGSHGPGAHSLHLRSKAFHELREAGSVRRAAETRLLQRPTWSARCTWCRGTPRCPRCRPRGRSRTP